MLRFIGCSHSGDPEARRFVELSPRLRVSVVPSSFLRSRMMLCIYILQPVESDVRVDLRGRDVGVSENGLDGAEIGAPLDHVGGATMAQHVRAGAASGAGSGAMRDLPDPLARNPLGATRDEQQRRRLPCALAF